MLGKASQAYRSQEQKADEKELIMDLAMEDPKLLLAEDPF